MTRSDPDSGFRLIAVKLFGPPGRDAELLSTALHDRDPRVWAEAIHWLWYHRKINKSFLTALTASLMHNDAAVRHQAVVALDDVAPLTALDTLHRLAELLHDPEAGIRRASLTTHEPP